MRSALIALLFMGAVSTVQGWINGLNMPWNHCGNDFGVFFDWNVFNEAFSRYQSAGANTVRVWVHYDANK
jgi:hypothetical protein